MALPIIIPTLTANQTAQYYGDGTKPLFITSSHDFFYGFGASEPMAWHRYKNLHNANLNVSTDYGKIWFFTPIGVAAIYISVGT